MQMRKKKILFVINTLGRAGAESALVSLLWAIDPKEYEIFLYVIMEQGDMFDELPSYVTLLNDTFCKESVLTQKGRQTMLHTVIRKCVKNGHWFRKLAYMLRVFLQMKKKKQVLPEKILWRVMSDGSKRFDETFDLAVAYLEGASTYYVADHVKAKKKAAFVHIDYESSGYTSFMDKDCYQKMDRIFCVSEEVKKHFTAVYPQYCEKTNVFHNRINKERILKKAKKPGGFSDQYDGIRLLTVGRLTYQKGYEVAIDAMKLLKESGYKVRWYVLGEGDEREQLERKIAQLGLQEDFLLLGSKKNPYPYYAQADIYVHATRFEGKSIAIQEAQILGKAVIASDCNGNREQITNGVDGILCKLDAESIAQSIQFLIENPQKRNEYAAAAKKKNKNHEEEMKLLFGLVQ